MLGEGKLSTSGLVVDLLLKRYWRNGALSRREEEVISPEDLVKEVWGLQYANEIGHVRRYICHLRQKVENDPESLRFIHNERGYGYRFSVVSDKQLVICNRIGNTGVA